MMIRKKNNIIPYKNKKLNTTPLVSVVVITYNSSKFILETLESIKNQTYKNIELVISDDCSTDNTFSICREWLNDNSINFKITKLVKTDKNGGISHNYNNGLSHVSGEWIKYIAGDDILLPECIEKFVIGISKTSDKFIICKEQHFDNYYNDLGVYPSEKNLRPFMSCNFSDSKRVKKQILHLLRNGTVLCGPTLFLHTSTLRKLGGFEEKYPFIEDYPLIMKFLKNGYPISCVNKVLVNYRVYSTSVSHTKADNRFSNSIFKAIDDYAIDAALQYRKYLLWYNLHVSQLIRTHKIKKSWGYTLRILDIIHWKNKLKLFINKI